MSKFPAYKTKAIAELSPYANNTRTHSNEQIDKVAASIIEFGFISPVVIDSDGTIVAGHCRVMAAKRIGLTHVPCIDAGHLTKAQMRAYVIADNRLALDGGWNDELLSVELSELAEVGFDIDVIGFDDDEIAKIFDETKGIVISDAVDDEILDSICVKFDPEKRNDVINAVSAAISDIVSAQIWCEDEQV